MKSGQTEAHGCVDSPELKTRGTFTLLRNIEMDQEEILNAH